jgi:putative transposase
MEKLVGQLTVEIDWLKKNLVLNRSVKERQAMMERNHPTSSIKRQASLLGINRTSVYRKPSEPEESADHI